MTWAFPAAARRHPRCMPNAVDPNTTDHPQRIILGAADCASQCLEDIIDLAASSNDPHAH
jgi:hypothetical protein